MIKLIVDKPLFTMETEFDENYIEDVKKHKEVIESTIYDSEITAEVTIIVDKVEMVPTAVVLSLRGMQQVKNIVEVHPKFEGWELTYSYLKSSHSEVRLIQE